MYSSEELKLASALRTVVARLVKKLRKNTSTGHQLSLTERSVLLMLYQHEQVSPSELAAKEKITNQSMSQILNHLKNLDFISRTPSETDKRRVNVALSKAGEDFILKVQHERDQWLAKAVAETCTADEQQLLSKAIGPLTKLIDFN